MWQPLTILSYFYIKEVVFSVDDNDFYYSKYDREVENKS